MAPERSKFLRDEIQSLVDAGILREISIKHAQRIIIPYLKSIGRKDVTRYTRDFCIFGVEEGKFGVEEGKFLGHIVTERGIKANPKKIQAIEDMKSPVSKKDVQRLHGCLAALTRFLSKAAEKSLPFMKVLKDFLLETNEKVEYDNKMAPKQHVWELHTDGASSEEGTGAGLVLTSPYGEEYTYALKFCFYASNSEAEYEALLSGFWWRQFQRDNFEVVKIPRNKNKKADVLSKLATLTFDHLHKRMLVEELKEKSIHEKPIMAIVEDNPFRSWCEELGIKKNFTSVAHPQANGHVEVTNKEIVAGIKARLGLSQTGWVDELPNVLWVHWTTPKRSTGETPFSLVYGTEAVIPAKICVPTQHIMAFDIEANSEALRDNLNLLEERRLMADIRQADHNLITCQMHEM
ncbi:uncharacterized protein [Rutidosis leptorrhynchoides]|uniref:uncharacterized protein n=1 Tax=Rutidosis leptorrhynchoides TaxID=125765 RepID=UPI003A99FBEF